MIISFSNKAFLAVSLGLILLGVILLFFISSEERKVVDDYLVIGSHKFYVEIADDELSRQKGLMYRESMNTDNGMLFVFPTTVQSSFWMKNTLIPLDILYISEEKKVVHIVHGAQPCKGDPCESYPSPKPYRYAVELNGGISEQKGIEEGDDVIFVLNQSKDN